MKCMIIDDDPTSVVVLENYISRISGLTLMASQTDSVAIIEPGIEEPVDFLFLDIRMHNAENLN